MNSKENSRRLSSNDRFVVFLDRCLRALTTGETTKELTAKHQPAHASPASQIPEAAMSHAERKHAAGLMRVNHSGEVCAQALYAGQATVARDPEIQAVMQQAAAEESDHLAWCAERLNELDTKPSAFDPTWRRASFGIGKIMGLSSDRLSLGFISATEDEVCHHLRAHIARLPEKDAKSRAILERMHDDEAAHGAKALAAGGRPFPSLVKLGMRAVSKLMTQLSYYR